MENFEKYLDSFNISKASTYHLSFLLNSYGYTYTITDTVRREVVAVKNQLFENRIIDEDSLKILTNSIQQDIHLNKAYKSEDFIYANKRSTLVPLEVFDKTKLRDYFSINHKLLPYEELHFNKIPSIKASNIFAIPSYLTTLMVNLFPEVRFNHQSSNMIKNLTSIPSKNKEVLINVSKGYLDIGVADKQALIFYNNFVYKSDHDFVYYVLSVLNKLSINSSEQTITVMGDIQQNSAQHKLLYNFVKAVKFAKINNLNYKIKKFPQHYFVNLISNF